MNLKEFEIFFILREQVHLHYLLCYFLVRTVQKELAVYVVPNLGGAACDLY